MDIAERLPPPAAAERPALRLLEKPLRRPAAVAAPALPAWRVHLQRWAGLIRR